MWLFQVEVEHTAAKELVTTTLLTVPAVFAARKALNVPSLAGMIRSSSCLGAESGNGLATCRTYVQS